MLLISLKLLKTFLVFLFLKQGCAQAESGGPAGLTLNFTGSEQLATFNFPQSTALSNEFLCLQIVVLSLIKKSHFCDIINNYYSDITNMNFENFSIYSLKISFEIFSLFCLLGSCG